MFLKLTMSSKNIENDENKAYFRAEMIFQIAACGRAYFLPFLKFKTKNSVLTNF